MDRVGVLDGATGALARPRAWRACLLSSPWRFAASRSLSSARSIRFSHFSCLSSLSSARAGRDGPTKPIVSNARQRILIIRVMSSPYESYFELDNPGIDRCDTYSPAATLLSVVRRGALAAGAVRTAHAPGSDSHGRL